MAETPRAILIIFMQLKPRDVWFAESMCKMFPAFATRYIIDEDRTGGKFVMDKIREAKTQDAYDDLVCKYSWMDKIITPVVDDGFVTMIREEFGEVKE